MKKDPQTFKKYLENERLRKNYSNLMKSTKTSCSTSESSPSSSTSRNSVQTTPSENTTTNTAQNHSAFSTKQSRSRSLKKADEHLPQSPRKKVEIIQNLASKYKMRMHLNEKRGRPRKELSDEKRKEWMIEFLGRSDTTYTNPGRQDNIYMGKVNGERKQLPKQYLLWTLRYLLDIINGAESNFESTFSEKLTFSQLYDFIKTHQQFIYNKDILHRSCLCDTCENTVLLAKGLNKKISPSSTRIPENPHDIVEKYSCSSDKRCMLDNCENCSAGGLCKLTAPTSRDDSGSDSDSDNSSFVTFYRWETPDKHVTKVQIRVRTLLLDSSSRLSLSNHTSTPKEVRISIKRKSKNR